MSENLSQEQIAALVEAAKQGELPQPPEPAARRTQRVRTVDFSRPTKFTADHQRRIGRALEAFCQTAATRMSAELRHTIEFETIDLSQASWLAAESALPAGSLTVLLEVAPVGTRMLLSAEAPFVFTALECLLGGGPERLPRERKMTEIDWSLTGRLFESIVGQLSPVWEELAGVSLRAGQIQSEGDPGQIASASEPTLVVVIETRIAGRSATLQLLIPWIAIEGIAHRISGRDSEAAAVDQAPSGIAGAIADVPVKLRAEVAALNLPIEQILTLAPGSVLKLGVSADRGVALFAENFKLGQGVPGANGSKRAVQVRKLEGELL